MTKIWICNGQSEDNESPLPPARPLLDSQARQLQCLTDHMTDTQKWVDEHGQLTSVVDRRTTIDASSVQNISSLLTRKIRRIKSAVRFLSLAHCKLNRIPAIFLIKDTSNRSLSETLEYVTFYGNSFTDISTPGRQYDVKLTASDAVDMEMDYEKPPSSIWAVGFYTVKFTKLLELDMRMCSIETLSENIFQEMPDLQALYLSGNNIRTISPNAFFGLQNLVNLDLSRNLFTRDKTMIFQSDNIFRALTRLRSLDLSYTKLTNSNVTVFTRLNKNFESISLCQTGISKLNDYTFMNTSLKYIDVSGNYGILQNYKALRGTEETLRIIIAENVGHDALEVFENFSKLEILNLHQNNVYNFYPNILKTLNNLKILDLTGNRLTTWFHPIMKQLDSSLMYLSIKDNYINLITDEMMEDFSKIRYLALSGNFIVCNCNVREMYELALRNEINSSVEPLMPTDDTCGNKYTKLSYDATYDFFNTKILNRTKLNIKCDDSKSTCQESRQNFTFEGDYVLIDYGQVSYSCMLPLDGKAKHFHDEETCYEKTRWEGVDEMLDQGRYEIITLIIMPGLILPVLIFVYVFRKNFKYCFVTIRNSTLLSLISKDDVVDDGTIFNYDVFVSYCNDDRNWVLDQLLPHVENDCNVSVCLHERDFQVGLSILENIVSCMDRSRSIMLIISKQFLLSQWCQFEMHLAQHRLLETRREDLILILLEEIPRRVRPTTLHYLMLTKTYIVWPSNQKEEAVFWRRLKKSLVRYQLKQPGNESLA